MLYKCFQININIQILLVTKTNLICKLFSGSTGSLTCGFGNIPPGIFDVCGGVVL